MCLACRIRAGPLCRPCRLELRPAAPVVAGRVPVRAAFRHEGPAAALVHRLKYDASHPAGIVLAAAMAGLVPSHASALIPVPRSVVRRLRYGIDAAEVLADELAVRTGLPVVDCFQRPWWHRRHAGTPRSRRRSHDLVLRRPVTGGVVVDDVFTTGATATAALAALPGAVGVVTATRA